METAKITFRILTALHNFKSLVAEYFRPTELCPKIKWS